MRHNLAYSGVMELVSRSYTGICAYIDLYIIAGSGKTILVYGIITIEGIAS